MNDNYLQNGGEGRWIFNIYNPAGDIGPYKGVLITTKDCYTVKRGDEEVVKVPAQNLAYCYNESLIGE